MANSSVGCPERLQLSLRSLSIVHEKSV